MSDIEDGKDRAGRDRDRSRRGERPTRFSDGIRDRSPGQDRDRSGGGGRKPSNNRVYVSNISYEYRWQDLKDLFRSQVGDVAFVELFVDDDDKPKGCGIVEFSDPSSVKKCMEVMHRFELKGRKLVIKEDFGNERDKHGNLIPSGGRRMRDRGGDHREWMDREPRRVGGNWDNNAPSLMSGMARNAVGAMGDGMGIGGMESKWGNTYGLSPQFLESLSIHKPLVNRVFIANLDYKVDEKKLREIFKLAGKVIDVELYHDKDGNSRGFAVIEYDHPVESVQAISMLHNQLVYDRPMIVRMDRIDGDIPMKLPEGLKSVGMGLGVNGEPLRDVSRNLPSANAGQGGGQGAGILGAAPGSGLQGLTAGGLGNALSTVGAQGLASLAGTSAAALQASLAAGVPTPFLSGVTGDLGLANLAANAASLGATSLNSLNTQSLANMNTALSGNQYRNSGDQNTGYGIAGGNNREYTTNRGEYDGPRNYDMKKDDYRDDYRQSSNMPLYSTVNNGSQSRGQQQQQQQAMGGGGGGGGKTYSSDTIVLSNLPPTTTWKLLREKCSTVGEVQYVEMKAKDTGIVRFSNEWEADRAVKLLDRSRLDGRSIDVRLF